MQQNVFTTTTTTTTTTTSTTTTGWLQIAEKFPEFSRFFQSHKLTFPQVIATKSKCNNDLHQGSFHVNSSTTGRRSPPHSNLVSVPNDPVYPVNRLTAVLHKYLNDELKVLCLLQFFPEVAHNSLRIPWVFHFQRNPWVFQVFQVCGHPVLALVVLWSCRCKTGWRTTSTAWATTPPTKSLVL